MVRTKQTAKKSIDARHVQLATKRAVLKMNVKKTFQSSLKEVPIKQRMKKRGNV